MDNPVVKLPSAEYPITVNRSASHFVIVFRGRTLADTTRALILRENMLPRVVYVPREDVNLSLLRRSTKETYCPYKGTASYFEPDVGGDSGDPIAWTYEQPFAAVSTIAGHIAFYADKMDSISESPTGNNLE